jgi:hypothetical protein
MNRKICFSELEKARKTFFLLQEIKQEIECSYDSYKSPDLSKISSGQKHISADPTAQAFRQIEQLREKYEILLSEFIDYQCFVSDRIDQIGIPLVRSIIMCHYFAGMDWKQTGITSPRKKVLDFLTTYEKELNAE